MDALLTGLGLGYNVLLVTMGAALLGLAAGGVGTFVLFRRRSLVTDAVSHATLPGVAIGFLVMIALGTDGRWLPGLLIGAAMSAAVGLLLIDRTTRTTRLSEDAAIGAVLSVFFGLGIVLLTYIQTLDRGRVAGLDGMVLGQTAGMLFDEALTIAITAAIACVLLVLLRRSLLVASFDPVHGAMLGLPARAVDLALMGLVLLVTVVGLKVVGLVLIVALMIIPPVAARCWSDSAPRIVTLGAVIGALSGAAGALVSAAGPDRPTGPVIVLIAFGLFVLSLLIAPARGLLALAWRRARVQRRVHRRQGLLALSRNEPIYDALTRRTLRREGLIRADGVATMAGRQAAAAAVRDEARWAIAREILGEAAIANRADSVRPAADIFTADQVASLDAALSARADLAPQEGAG